MKKAFIIFLTVIICAASFGFKVTAAPSVSAMSAVLIEAESGRIIYSKNAEKRMPMASTTKIMTAAAVVMLEKNLEKRVTVSAASASVEGSSMGLKAGEGISLKALLYGLMLESGNDAATAIYEAFCGEALIDIMNIIAKEHLELKNTNFTNPHGLPDENHYSTALDMAKIMRFALCFEEFCEITSQKSQTVLSGERSIYLHNHNRLLTEVEGCDGGKTGYTLAAGRCLVTTAERNGVRLICVTLNAPDDWQDHKNLYNWGFQSLSGERANFSKKQYEIAVTGGTKNKIFLTAEAVEFPLLKEEKIIEEAIIPTFLYSPVKVGEVVGFIKYSSGNETVITVPVYCNENSEVKEKEFLRLFKKILLAAH